MFLYIFINTYLHTFIYIYISTYIGESAEGQKTSKKKDSDSTDLLGEEVKPRAKLPPLLTPLRYIYIYIYFICVYIYFYIFMYVYTYTQTFKYTF
jgi:hypothetical protein